MFTQKHYVAIADVIHAERTDPTLLKGIELCTCCAEARRDQINRITLALTKLFKEDNSKFKEFTFIEACNRDLKG